MLLNIQPLDGGIRPTDSTLNLLDLNHGCIKIKQNKTENKIDSCKSTNLQK